MVVFAQYFKVEGVIGFQHISGHLTDWAKGHFLLLGISLLTQLGPQLLEAHVIIKAAQNLCIWSLVLDVIQTDGDGRLGIDGG